MRCMTSGRFSMNAEILGWSEVTEGDNDDVTPGSWDTYQDPITGEIFNDWTAADDPSTPDVNEAGTSLRTVECIARGIVDGGIRVAGTTERFGDTYENIDYVKMWVPAYVKITKRDRVTNIRDRKGGNVIWRDEERDGEPPTVFNVNGVTPLFDAFNRHVESFVLLERVSDL